MKRTYVATLVSSLSVPALAATIAVLLLKAVWVGTGIGSVTTLVIIGLAAAVFIVTGIRHAKIRKSRSEECAARLFDKRA